MIIVCDRNGKKLSEVDALRFTPGVHVRHLGDGRVRIGGRATEGYVSKARTVSAESYVTGYVTRFVTRIVRPDAVTIYRTIERERQVIRFIPSLGTKAVTATRWTATKMVTRYFTLWRRTATRWVTRGATVTATLTRETTLTRFLTRDVTNYRTATNCELTNIVSRVFTRERTVTKWV